jgi:hypothetical protein
MKEIAIGMKKKRPRSISTGDPSLAAVAIPNERDTNENNARVNFDWSKLLNNALRFFCERYFALNIVKNTHDNVIAMEM